MYGREEVVYNMYFNIDIGNLKEDPRSGRRWFAMESKSFELLIDDIGEKLRGCIWERCRGRTSWIRFGDASLSSLLTGVEICCRGNDDRS